MISLRPLFFTLLLLATPVTSNAWFAAGHVYCDANTNLVIDDLDVPVGNVLVAVTNTSGTFSNVSLTASDGSFVVLLAEVPDEYKEFVVSDSLPVGTTGVNPGVSSFVAVDGTGFTNDFLIQNTACLPLPSGPAVVGHIYCDANSNSVIDLGDIQLAHVIVSVTNVSGTFSNFVVADIRGFYSLQLPPVADSYGTFLPIRVGNILVPGPDHAYHFSIPGPDSSNITNDFLVGRSCGGAFEVGHVYCDANTNGLVDSADVPVSRVLVVVTNVSGTFSNTSLTTSAGAFSMVLPGTTDTYVDYLLAPTLPAGTVAVLPPLSSFIVSNGVTVTHDFLLENPDCVVPGLAPNTVGHIYCDANTNALIDSGDTPVANAMVVVTNFSDSFSNVSFTDANGFFSISLRVVPDQYGEYIARSSLAAGTAVVIPGRFHDFRFTNPPPAGIQIVTNDFLVSNPACLADPAPNLGQCWLIGGGVIKSGKQIQHRFGCLVNPARSSTAQRVRSWTDTDFTQNLQFKGVTAQVIDCGSIPGQIGTSSMDFQGTGTLKGIAKNKVDYGPVQFFGHAEHIDGARNNADRLYFRVFDASGNTLLLISADSVDPLGIAPVAMSSGKLQIRSWK